MLVSPPEKNGNYALIIRRRPHRGSLGFCKSTTGVCAAATRAILRPLTRFVVAAYKNFSNWRSRLISVDQRGLAVELRSGKQAWTANPR